MDGTIPQSRTISDTHLYGASVVALVLLACPALVLRAAEVYKSVDSEGHVVYSDRADRSTAPQTLVRIEGAEDPPRVLHFCWTNCFTLALENGRYVRTDGSDETWTIERFTSTSVVLHRHDAPSAWNGLSADVPYQGQVSNGQLINVTVNGNAVPDIQMAWGAALDTLPGSNVERDQRKSSPAMAMAIQSPTNIDSATDFEARATEAPPPLTDDEQPPCPTEGYLWTPGYWAWVGGGYYWVRGVWVQPPRVGVLWTPGYWGFVGAFYVFHRGYWGTHIGYYGGINYGFGYAGLGFAGGRWVGNSFAYNRAVNNVNLNIVHNTYSEAAINQASVNRVSYNGGPGGTTAVPTAQERAAGAEPHIPPTSLQHQIAQQALRTAPMAQPNSGSLTMAAAHTPATSNAPRVVGAHGGSASPPAHVSVAPSTGNRPKVKVAPMPPNPAARAQDTAEQAPAPKPAGATPSKTPHHPKK